MFVREKSELVVILEDRINDEFIRVFENFHNNFPNVVCYIKDNTGHTKGIFSWREYKQSSYMGRLCFNTGFGYITKEMEGDIEAFHIDHPGFVNLPVVSNGIVEREYCFTEKKWVSEYFEWHLIRDDILLRVIKRHSKEQAVNFYNEELSNRCGVRNNPISEAVLIVMDMPGYYDYLQERWKEGIFKEEDTVLSEYNLYIECLIVQMMEAFNENNIIVEYVGAPNASRMDTLSDRDKQLLLCPTTVSELQESREIDKLYSEYPKSLEFMKNKEYRNVGFHFVNGHFSPTDYTSDSLNVVGGVRLTCDVPENYSNQVCIYGICVARGAFCADCDTVESFLQRKINLEHDEWAVVNHGVAEGIVGAALNDMQYVLHSKYRSNDIVIFLSEYDHYTINLLRENDAEIYESSELFEGDKVDQRWFVDIMPHTTPKANEMIADYIFDKIESDINIELKRYNDFISIAEMDLNTRELPVGIKDYINSIKRKLDAEGVTASNKVVGAIVMNCNPFTNGHRYLIEEAKKKCDELLIFVVSEDRSQFLFEDRFRMVNSAVSAMRGGGIHVFESGRFMISQDTFPEYFYKDKAQDLEVDSSYDVSLFGGYIAPELGIKIRFAGEEPQDKVTESYNRTMERILKEYDITFCEIPRIKDNEGVISATRVRNCMDNYDLDGLRQLVPESTFEIIKDKYL